MPRPDRNAPLIFTSIGPVRATEGLGWIEGGSVLEAKPEDPFRDAPVLTDSQFRFFGRLAYDKAGIVIADFKRSMVLRRVLRRVKALELCSVDEYCRLLNGPAGEVEIEQLINALTTNKTSFFREAHHFDHLREYSIPALVARKHAERSTRLRIWSAGCSSGEEAWSIAMAAAEALSGRPPSAGTWDLKILATDIDTEMVAAAKRARYLRAELAPVAVAAQHRYFEPVVDDDESVQVADELRRLVTFKSLNLHDEWPFQGPFDIIFCRNVVIYFDRSAQRQLFDRFAEMLAEGGLLYCGHSESLLSLSDRFRPVGRSVYARVI